MLLLLILSPQPLGNEREGGELFMHPFPSYFIQKIFFPGQYPSQQGRIRDCLMIKIRFSESHELPFPSKTRWGKYSRKCTVQVKRLSWGKIFLSFACSLLCFVLPGVFFREPACCVVGWIVVWLYRRGVGKWGVPGRRNKIKNCEGLRGKRLNPTTNSLKQRRKKGVPFSTPKKIIRNLEIPFRPRKGNKYIPGKSRLSVSLLVWPEHTSNILVLFLFLPQLTNNEKIRLGFPSTVTYFTLPSAFVREREGRLGKQGMKLDREKIETDGSNNNVPWAITWKKEGEKRKKSFFKKMEFPLSAFFFFHRCVLGKTIC